MVVARAKAKFYLSKQLCKLVPNNRVIEGKSSFVVQIDAEENRGLMEDIEENLFNKSHQEDQGPKQKRIAT